MAEGKELAQDHTSVMLNSGHRMPLQGFGTYVDTFKPDVSSVVQLVETALEVGFRHFDTAHMYGTEQGIGQAIKNCISKGVITREQLFITTKLLPSSNRYKDVVPSLKESLQALDLPYVDLYLIHWPTAIKPGTESGKENFEEDVDYVDTWKGMEECVDLGLTKSIGVSNFNSKQIQRVLDMCRIPPANNQVECHPYLNNGKLIKFCQERKISMSGYSPLGGSDLTFRKEKAWPTIYTNETLAAIAEKHKCSIAQVALKYQLNRGVCVIPKSARRERMIENFQAVNVKLTSEDITEIDKLDSNIRICDQFVGHVHYPFTEEF